MKKMIAGLMALAVVAGVAQAEETLSRNAVGFVKRTVPAGKLQIVSIPFDNLASTDGTYKFGETQVAEDMPVGSSAMFWDIENQRWLEANKTQRQGWGGYATRPLAPGEPFFLRNNSAADIDVTLAGEVPDAETVSCAYAGAKALSFVAEPYPVDKNFGDTEIAETLAVGSSAMFWDTENQRWLEANKTQRQGWGGYATRALSAGEGFFVRSGSEGSWEAGKPYDWP